MNLKIFRRLVRTNGLVAVHRATAIYTDRAELYPDSGRETVDYVHGDPELLLTIAARCLYEVTMRCDEAEIAAERSPAAGRCEGAL